MLSMHLGGSAFSTVDICLLEKAVERFPHTSGII